MENWKQTRQDINTRAVELNALIPETMKGVGILGAAGSKTNHLDAKTRELIALAVAVTGRDEHAEGQLGLAVAQERAQHARGELAAGQLQHHDRDREERQGG